MQPVPYPLANQLITAQISLPVFPADEVWNRCGESFHECRRRMKPIAAVDEHTERRGLADAPVVRNQTVVVGTRIVRWKCEYPIHASRRSLPRKFGRD